MYAPKGTVQILRGALLPLTIMKTTCRKSLSPCVTYPEGSHGPANECFLTHRWPGVGHAWGESLLWSTLFGHRAERANAHDSGAHALTRPLGVLFRCREPSFLARGPVLEGRPNKCVLHRMLRQLQSHVLAIQFRCLSWKLLQ